MLFAGRGEDGRVIRAVATQTVINKVSMAREALGNKRPGNHGRLCADCASTAEIYSLHAHVCN